MISIDGWRVPGYETKVSAAVKIKGDDASGFGSFALSLDQGIKASVLTVKTKIPFAEEHELEVLISKAKALDENGARRTYTINSPISAAYKIRRAKFDGDVKATEDEDVRAWLVSFNLLEVRSVSERQQQQLDSKGQRHAAAQSTTGHEKILAQFSEVEGP